MKRPVTEFNLKIIYLREQGLTHAKGLFTNKAKFASTRGEELEIFGGNKNPTCYTVYELCLLKNKRYFKKIMEYTFF